MRSGNLSHPCLSREDSGFTLLAVLGAVLFLALASQQVMVVVSQQAQREREAELLRVGAEIRRAIAAYYERSPGTTKVWPPSLEVLTDDRRFVTLERHLRRVYADPITRSNDWGLVPGQGGGISGVYSKSDASPIRTGGYELEELGLSKAERYSEWKFVYVPTVVGQDVEARP